MPTRDEIRQAYDAGFEAVVALFDATFKQMDERLKALEARLNQNSQNSHRPPSSDGYQKPRPKSLRQKSGRLSGGQKGHTGTTLEMVSDVHRYERHYAAQCARCGQKLSASGGDVQERRQVFDLPPAEIEVVEHQVMRSACPECGHENVGTFPTGVEQPTQYGSGVNALGVYLAVQQVLPMERTCELLAAMSGQRPSEGTLANALETCAAALQPVEEQIKAAVSKSAVSHYDETGIRVAGRLNWLHVASTEQLTHYTVDAQRGSAAHERIGILPYYGGIAVHDAYASYFQHDCQHGLCNGHHLRELTAVHEQTQQAWAAEMKAVLVEAKREVDAARAAGQMALSPERQAAITCCYHTLLDEAHKANPPPERAPGQRGRLKLSPAGTLAARMNKHTAEVLFFIRDFRVPFDNNQAERDLRMMKVKQKVSGCFRSADGANIFCRIRGYLSTIRKQGGNALAVLRSLFDGHIVMPQLG